MTATLKIARAVTRSHACHVQRMNREFKKAIRLDAIAAGLPYQFGYIWKADGYRQIALFDRTQAAEHNAWLKANDHVARRAYIRNLETGRFCRV